MSTIQNLFQQAQLAEAAYADFSDPNVTAKQALQNEGFSETQATEFLANWREINQSPPLGFFGNGFSATLFERLDANQQPTGQYTLSIAGSVSPTDFANDLLDLNSGGVAYFQVQEMINYVLRLQAGSTGTTRQIELLTGATAPSWTNTQVSGVGPGITPYQLTITGHSLGGFLGQVFQRIFGSAGVTTYNALGVVRPDAPVFDQLTALLGLPSGSFGSGPGENLLVPGEPAQLIGTVQGKPQIQIFSETESTTINPIDTIPAHKIGPVTDALALYNLFATLDLTLNTANPANGIGKITSILKAASADPAKSLEVTLDKLRTLFEQNYVYGNAHYNAVPTMAGGDNIGRDDYYSKLYALQQIIKDQPFTALHIESLTGKTSGQLVQLAQIDPAYRYALYKLNPFAVTGASALYDAINSQHELDLYNPTTGQGQLSAQYLKDRAAFLADLIVVGTADQIENSSPWLKYGGPAQYFEDNSGYAQTKLYLGADKAITAQPIGDITQIKFGGWLDDAITGGSKADHLYGMSGDDTLTGNAGNDYLEGGAGNDTYIIGAGDGTDTVLDTDGTGSLILDGTTLTGGALVDGTANVWKNTAQGITYTLKGTGSSQVLLISKDGSSDGIRIQGWQSGQLGLAMAGAPAPTANTPIIGQDGYSDGLTGTGGADLMQGLSGNDALDGSAGDDVIEGGLGDDLIAGSSGTDLLYGGTGRDMILSATGLNLPGHLGSNGEWAAPAGAGATWTQGRLWGIYASSDANGPTYIIDGGGPLGQDTAGDIVFAGDDEDRVVGGLGDDYIDGGLGNDNLTGHGGNDVIDGGDGEDYLQGDGTILPGYYTSVAEIQHGNDVLDGGAGDDVIEGGLGDDLIGGNSGSDLIYGGAGRDMILSATGLNWATQKDRNNDGILDDWAPPAGAGAVWTQGRVWGIYANAGGSETIDGGGALGQDGAPDIVFAGDDDKVVGGLGADYIDGGLGNDMLWGHGGNDDDHILGDGILEPGFYQFWNCSICKPNQSQNHRLTRVYN